MTYGWRSGQRMTAYSYVRFSSGKQAKGDNWMRIGLAIARADHPAATPPLMPNRSPFRD